MVPTFAIYSSLEVSLKFFFYVPDNFENVWVTRILAEMSWEWFNGNGFGAILS